MSGRRLFGAAGLSLMLYECILFLPLFVFGLWPRAKASGHPAEER